MTVSRKSKQVKNNATRKNEKSKRKTIKKYPKKSKNVTLKLRQSGGGPIEFIQWIFAKLLELFTFNKNNRGGRNNDGSGGDGTRRRLGHLGVPARPSSRSCAARSPS